MGTDTACLPVSIDSDGVGTAQTSWGGSTHGTDRLGRSVPSVLGPAWLVPTAAGAGDPEQDVIIWLVHVFNLNSELAVWIHKLAIFYH
jgi:hypothetical protein